uniref:Uncharacterized protein n=1 Tax=Anguilla anguilla TaxID=7936 RepID=A0A0E9Q3E5_ANGAN
MATNGHAEIGTMSGGDTEPVQSEVNRRIYIWLPELRYATVCVL